MDKQHHDQDQDLDHGDNNSNDHQNILKPEPGDLDHGDDGDLDHEDKDSNGENLLNTEPDPLYSLENNPPESFSVCQAKVADWLDRHTVIERKTSVKLAISRNLDPTQNRSSHRCSVPLNHRPKLSIIGFRKKAIHQTDGKSKQSDRAENVRLFRNRSEPGRDYCLLITEPVSPRVSCVGRVGSVRVQGRKAGVWRSVKAALSNLVQTTRVPKMV